VFANWVILNQATIDELGEETGGLRKISKNSEHTAIFRELESTEFRSGFMNMSDQDEQALDVHKRKFKNAKRRYHMATYAL